MVPNSNIHLVPAQLEALRPTQMTVGYREVAAKREHWKALRKKARRKTIASHWFPVVLGPQGRQYVIDHHHLGLALFEEGVREVTAMVIKDLSWLDDITFWRMMEHGQWVHPFDTEGKRHDYDRLPKVLTGLENDPYRSLAGELRGAGGYAKDTTPFSEFLWADFLRQRISPSRIEKNFARALDEAKALAHLPEARYLPGWSGVAAAG
ncbi:ParB-like protein [Paraburkholderia sp. BR14263]|uniref:ParB-like protein n=1 Tax=unclassified Paraburkholderia TaxID=2615204 RepID=UPI0034CE254E